MTSQSSTKLIVTTPSDREIVMTRVFDAPRALVFRAYTVPDLIPKWWGQRASTTAVDSMDVRPGGAWRFVQSSPDGNEYGFSGEFREITSPSRLVYTFEFEGMPGHILVETIEFEERDGKTSLTSTSVFNSMEERDRMLNSGMEEGAVESMDRLTELLAELS